MVRKPDDILLAYQAHTESPAFQQTGLVLISLGAAFRKLTPTL